MIWQDSLAVAFKLWAALAPAVVFVRWEGVTYTVDGVDGAWEKINRRVAVASNVAGVTGFPAHSMSHRLLSSTSLRNWSRHREKCAMLRAMLLHLLFPAVPLCGL